MNYEVTGTFILIQLNNKRLMNIYKAWTGFLEFLETKGL